MANIIKEQGVLVIDADRVVRELTSSQTEYMKKIVDTFGEIILDEEKHLNRKMLSNIIYTNKEKKQQLDDLTSIYVVEEIEDLIEQNKNEELILIDAPLLIESGLSNKSDIVISVLCDFDTRIKRICNRDGIDEDKAKQRLEAQQNDDFYIKNSDFVVYNNGDMQNLKEQINKIIKL